MVQENTNITDEFKVVPGWAIGLAVMAFVVIQSMMVVLGFKREANPPPAILRFGLGFLVAALIASLIMLVGYVNRDAKRRGMRVWVWTAIVIFVPNAIGFILYFVLRQPLSILCPHCGATVSARFNFCPNCKYGLRPACPECKHEIRPGDRFCPHCAHDLSAGPAADGKPLKPLTPGATA